MQSCLQGGVCRYTSLGGAAWRPGPGSKAPQGEGRPRAPGAASLWSRRGTSPDQVPPLSLGLRLEERPLRRPTTPLSPGASSRPEASAPASRMEKGSPAFSAVGLSGARWRALRGSQDDVGVQRVTASPAQIGSHCASDQKRPVHAGPSDWTQQNPAPQHAVWSRLCSSGRSQLPGGDASPGPPPGPGRGSRRFWLQPPGPCWASAPSESGQARFLRAPPCPPPEAAASSHW